MIVIMGATGRTGRVAAEHVARQLGQAAVRVVSRRPLAPMAERGFDVALARLSHEGELSRALQGARALYALLPDDVAAPHFRADRIAMADAMARAVRRAEVAHVVMASSSAAALGEQGVNGFAADLAYFERVMQDSNASVTVLRACYFQDNVSQALPMAERDGVYPCFFHAPDRAITTIAATDVGAIAARALLDGPRAPRQIIDLVGPRYSARDIAEALARTTGREVAITRVPRAHQEPLFRQAMSPEAAHAMVETLECLGSGRITLSGDRIEHGVTTLEQTLLAARTASALVTS